MGQSVPSLPMGTGGGFLDVDVNKNVGQQSDASGHIISIRGAVRRRVKFCLSRHIKKSANIISKSHRPMR